MLDALVGDLQVPGGEVLQLPQCMRGQDITHPVPMEGDYIPDVELLYETCSRHGKFRGLDHRAPDGEERAVPDQLRRTDHCLVTGNGADLSPADPAAVEHGERGGVPPLIAQ